VTTRRRASGLHQTLSMRHFLAPVTRWSHPAPIVIE
jgi:hypothetical protein